MLFARDMSQFVGMLLNEGKIFCKVEMQNAGMIFQTDTRRREYA